MKVLFVDDEPAIRRLFEAIAEQAGCEARTAEDGEAGLAAFNDFQPDVVFLDINMPRLDGLALLERVRRDDPDVIAVMITGAGTEDAAVQALRLGASNYIAKPVGAKDLLDLLSKYEATVGQKEMALEIRGLVREHTLSLSMDNNVGLATGIARYLVQLAGEFLAPAIRMQITLGLGELITNAIEHGNMAIAFEEKDAALSETGGLSRLYEARLADPAVRDRRVEIRFRADPGACSWVIADQGAGFDPDAVPSPLDGPQAFKKCGRGIFLARRIFDEVVYTPPGNQVRAVKLVPGDG